jgi:hypothetical protein
MPDPTPAQVRRAALLALVWWTAERIDEDACWAAGEDLRSLGLDSDATDWTHTARAYLEAAQRELKAMEEGAGCWPVASTSSNRCGILSA